MSKKNLFEKAVVFGDIHFGKKNNDRQFNQDCSDYIDWFIKEAKDYGADCCIFLGDWHDNRYTIHLSTLDFSMKNLEKINAAFEKSYFISGNHDLFYKEKRDLYSVSIGKNFDNIILINDFVHEGNVTFCPWLVGDEWKKIKKYSKKSDYVFGHFELPTFMMNAMVEMPDHGGLNHSHFSDVTYMTFSGHFHKRQIKDNVCYIGSPFPHDYSDNWDDDRGMVLLEWGKQPIFKRWDNAPKYRTFNMSDILNDPDNAIDDRTYLKISIDIDIDYEEEQYIKNILGNVYGFRRMEIIPYTDDEDQFDFSKKSDFQTVDQIVLNGLKNIDSLTLNKSILIELYNSLEV